MAALDEAQAALRGLVADFTNRDESALTGAEVVAWLESSGASEELREAMQRLNDAVEACHFGGGAPPRDRLDTLLAALTPIFEMGKGGDRKGAVRAPSVLLLLALLSGVAMAQDVETFQSAQAAFARGDAEEAARLFSSMLDAGYENGYVLYNLGNCQLRAGKIGEAIAAYRRASLYLPGDANVALNLQRALDARSEPLSLPESRPISDYVLFWRSHLSAGSELRITALCAALAFALALVRLLVGRRLTAVLWSVRILALIALLFGISAALDAQALNARDHGATCGEATVVRSGPGESFEPSYEQSIGAGAEFEVLGRSGEWLQVRIAGRYEGWIAESSAALW